MRKIRGIIPQFSAHQDLFRGEIYRSSSALWRQKKHPEETQGAQTIRIHVLAARPYKPGGFFSSSRFCSSGVFGGGVFFGGGGAGFAAGGGVAGRGAGFGSGRAASGRAGSGFGSAADGPQFPPGRPRGRV